MLLFQTAQHLVELIEIAIADAQNSAALAVIDADHEAERIRNALFQRDEIGIFSFCCRDLRPLVGPDPLFWPASRAIAST